MYKTYFGLKREPFSVAADPRFLYMSSQHKQAAQHLLFGLQSGAGFILLTGEIGAGKTMVCRAFLRLLPPNADVANVVNPRVDFRALLVRICEELRIEVAPDCPDLIDAIHGHLLLAHAQGRRTLIVVDEAQALSHEVLELLRLLTNLDSTGRKLQIFLIGQPELRATLRLPALEPVSQRIVARFHLGPLPESETARYIEHRLRKAGLAEPLPFDAEAMQAIHRACGGVPRRINVLCDRAMLTAKNLGTHQIGTGMITRITPEVFDLPAAAADSAPTEMPAPSAHNVAEALADEAPSASAGYIPPMPRNFETLAPAPATVSDSGADPQHPVGDKGRWRTIAAVAVSAIVACTALGVVLSDFLQPRSPDTHARQAPARTYDASARPPAENLSDGPPTNVSTPPASNTSSPAGTSVPAAPAVNTSAAPPPDASGTLPANAEPPPAQVAAAARDPPPTVQTLTEAATSSESTAWRALALLWGVKLPPGDPCAALVQHQLRCHRAKGGLESIRRLDRPSLLSLKNSGGHAAFTLLVGLATETALVRNGNRQYRVALGELAGAWGGEFATLWRAPPQFRPGMTAEDGNMAQWLQARFAVLDGGNELSDATAINKRIAEFQMAQGLQPDAVAGPVTLMMLNRLSKVSEPQLFIER